MGIVATLVGFSAINFAISNTLPAEIVLIWEITDFKVPTFSKYFCSAGSFESSLFLNEPYQIESPDNYLSQTYSKYDE
jgi:hypothetical protein